MKIIGWFLALSGKWKILLGVTFLGFLVIGVHNTIVGIIEILTQFALAKLAAIVLPSGIQGVAQYVGFGAWLSNLLKLSDCMSFITSVIAAKWIWRKIPFVGW